MGTGLFLTPKEHAIAASGDVLTLESLAEHPLITYVFSTNGRSSFLDAFREQSLEPNVVFTARDAKRHQNLCKNGMGVGVMAPMAVAGKRPRRTRCNLCQEPVSYRYYLDWHPKRPRPARYMLDFLQMFAPQWSEDLINKAIVADSQETVDELAADVELPIKTGCILKRTWV